MVLARVRLGEIDDAYATGIVDHAAEEEPGRGRAGPGRGRAAHRGPDRAAITLKGLPLAYDRDLQEDKEPVFDAVDTLLVVLRPWPGWWVAAAERGACRGGRRRATRWRPTWRSCWSARGVAFREAHEVVGHLVVWCQVHDCELADVSDADLARISPLLTPDVRERAHRARALAARDRRGGTAPARVTEQLSGLRAAVAEQAAWASG